MRHIIYLASLVVVSFSFSGCATITSGTSQTITITSNVDGAAIFLDGELVGMTPFTGKVKKNKNTFRIEKEGYQIGTVTTSKSLDPLFWGNIITGGTIGSITDFASGAAYTYAPATYQVNLRANGQTLDDFMREVAIRKFAMLYINEISQDLARGAGDYLSALIEIIDSNHVNQKETSKNDIRTALASSRGNQVIFGDVLVNTL
jgi:hypothetical protein